MRPKLPLRTVLADPLLLGGALAGDSWLPWRTLLIAAMGEELTADERIVFKQLTGREREPGQRVHELEVVAGRRGGKTKAVSTLAAYIACLCEHTDVLAPGERGILLCVALDQRVAKIMLDYAQAAIEQSPILQQLIAARTSEAIELTNGISIEVRSASFRKLRGPTYVGVIADELAFWYTDDSYANPDIEILNAVRPGLLTTHGPLIMASSPYARRGVLWDTYNKHYGPNGAPSILVAKGSTRDFNSTISQAEIDRELERDRVRNTAELLAEFRSDLEAFVSIDVVEDCVGDYREMAPALANSYFAFVDPAGGSGQDAFTLAISHRDDERVIIDCVREIRPPFSPENVIEELVGTLKSYGVYTATGDRYAGGFPREQFEKRNIIYDCSEKVKSDIYRELLPLLNSKHITIPRHDRLIAQLVGLERKVARGSGKDSIDHAPNAHDDIANAVAGAALLAGVDTYNPNMRWAATLDSDLTPEEQRRAEEQWVVDQYFMRTLGARNFFHAR